MSEERPLLLPQVQPPEKPLKLFDTHAHYSSRTFKDDRDEVLASLPLYGVERVIEVGVDITRRDGGPWDLAARHDHVYFAAGVHPQEASDMGEGDIDRLRDMLKKPKAVALGEIGLDYYYESSPREIQKPVFRAQMELAREMDMPVIIHTRDATRDTMEILKDFPGMRGVCHCFSGSLETAVDLIKMGYMISFTGVISFKNAKRAAEIIRWMPLDRLMLETDCPYMSPEPHRGRRCDSRLLEFTCMKAAEIRGISPEEMAEITTANAHRFFGI